MRVLLAGRLRTLDDVANAAEYLASDLAGFISGQHLLVKRRPPDTGRSESLLMNLIVTTFK